MIQIIGYGNDKAGKKIVRFINEPYSANSVIELFDNIDSFLSIIPKKDHVNLHYTLGHTEDRKGRSFDSCETIAFDLDDIDISRTSDYISIVKNEIKFPDDGTIIFSGHGLHFIIHLNYSMSLAEIEEVKPFYIAACAKLNKAFKEYDLPGLADTNVFRNTATLRLPNTMNMKVGKQPVMCNFIRRTWGKVFYKLQNVVSENELIKDNRLKVNEIKEYPKPDTKGVLSECLFLRYCKENKDSIKEPSWYAMLTILCRLDDGNKLCHEYSDGHPTYSFTETENKIEQAKWAAGPRTCYNISTLWDGCFDCPHYKEGKIISPITIESDDFIPTKDTGFYKTVSREHIDEMGNKKIIKARSKPCYTDLRKWFDRNYSYATLAESKMTYVIKNNIWEEFQESYLLNFAEENFNPSPSSAMCKEFSNLIYRTNLRDSNWFNPPGKINLRNGVLDMDNMVLLPHSPDFGFTYQLDYDYDITKKCPRFDKFLDEVTLNRKDIQEILLEFAGYCISNMEYKYQKAMILVGEGANGKSTFLNVLSDLVGQKNYSCLTLEEMNKDTARINMYNKLFNLAEETPSKAFLDSNLFKNLVGGGPVTARHLFKDGISFRNRTKLINACNELPLTGDPSHGMFRRLLIVPFDAIFVEGKNMNIFLQEELREELPGILNKVIAGYKRLNENNGFTKSLNMERVHNEYKKDSDSIFGWFSECVYKDDVNNNSFTSSKEFYSNYKNYCTFTNIKPKPFNFFSKRLNVVFKQEGVRGLDKSGERNRGYIGYILTREDF